MGISVGSLDEGYNVGAETREMLRIPGYESAFDDVTGAQLTPEKVAQARRTDIEFLRSFLAYKPVDSSEADGHEVIDTRWVDASNGDDNANVRSRLCAPELKRKNPWLENAFAGAP
eukprot:3522510-Pyramimonas_sp.AAC.1